MFYESPSHYANYEKVLMALENDSSLNLSCHKWVEIDINAEKAWPVCPKLESLPKSIQLGRGKAESKINNMLVGKRDDSVVHVKFFFFKETVKSLIICDISGKFSLVLSFFDRLGVILLRVFVFGFCKRFV